MTKLKYLRDEARAECIQNQLKKYPTLKNSIETKIKEEVEKGRTECVLYFEEAGEADFAEIILNDSGYGCYRLTFEIIEVWWN